MTCPRMALADACMICIATCLVANAATWLPHGCYCFCLHDSSAAVNAFTWHVQVRTSCYTGLGFHQFSVIVMGARTSALMHAHAAACEEPSGVPHQSVLIARVQERGLPPRATTTWFPPLAMRERIGVNRLIEGVAHGTVGIKHAKDVPRGSYGVGRGWGGGPPWAQVLALGVVVVSAASVGLLAPVFIVAGKTR